MRTSSKLPGLMGNAARMGHAVVVPVGVGDVEIVGSADAVIEGVGF
jgi:hypothetical protein